MFDFKIVPTSDPGGASYYLGGKRESLGKGGLSSLLKEDRVRDQLGKVRSV